MLSIIAASMSVALLPLPNSGGTLPTLPTLPTTGGGGGRPGPPNKGTVEWVGPVQRSITVVEVDQKSVVEDQVSKQKWTAIPDWLHYSTAHLLAAGVAGMELKLSCPLDNGDNIPCTFYVVLYNCIPCSTAGNGGLPSELLAKDFVTGGCGPRYHPVFPFEPSKEREYQTAIYKMEVAAGDSVTVPLVRELTHAAIFELSVGQQCSLATSLTCASKAGCVLDNASMKCVDAPMCPMKFKGPVQGETKKCACFTAP